MAKSSQVLSIERREGVSMAEVVMDDMAIGNPASLMAQLWRLGPLPRLPYSAVPFARNRELWRNFPGATQQWPEGKNLPKPGRRAGREIRSGPYSLASGFRGN